MQLLRTVYNEEVRPRLHPGDQEEMREMLEWLATKVADGTVARTLRDTLLDKYRRTADEEKDDEEDADEETGKPNPTPLMQALNPFNFTPGFANWAAVEKILDGEDWESTLAWTWPTNAQGPSGYSAIHLAANKQDKDGKSPDEKQSGTARQLRCLERIFGAAIRRGCLINSKFGNAGGTIMHMAVTSSNFAVLKALSAASDTLAPLGAQLQQDWHPDWTAMNSDGVSPLGMFILKHVSGRGMRPLSLEIQTFLRERLGQVGWSIQDIEEHEREMTDRAHELKRERKKQTLPPRPASPPPPPWRPLTPQRRAPQPPPPPLPGRDREDRHTGDRQRSRPPVARNKWGGKGPGREGDDGQQRQWSQGYGRGGAGDEQQHRPWWHGKGR